MKKDDRPGCGLIGTLVLLGLHGWREMRTLSSYPPDGPEPELGPFNGQALIAVQTVEAREGDMEALLAEILAAAGPGQILEGDRHLIPFDRRELTLAGRPAARLETMSDFGTVNHVLAVLDGTRGFILRGQGDGRIFDAVAGSLRLP